MEHDIKGLIVENFNKEYPWLFEKQKRRAGLVASKAIEDVHCIQIGDLFIPANIPQMHGVDIVCRGRTVFKDAFICASMCIAIHSLIQEVNAGTCVVRSFDYKDKLDDLYQLIDDYAMCLNEAKWVESTVEDKMWE